MKGSFLIALASATLAGCASGQLEIEQSGLTLAEKRLRQLEQVLVEMTAFKITCVRPGLFT